MAVVDAYAARVEGGRFLEAGASWIEALVFPLGGDTLARAKASCRGSIGLQESECLMRRISVVLGLVLVCTSCAAGRDISVPASDGFASEWAVEGFDHGLWTAALSRHVDEAGMVDYGAMATDEQYLEYLHRLANTDPGSVGDSDARLAFWINAYNALVVQGVLETLPQDRGNWAEYSVLKVKIPGVLRPGKGFFVGLSFVIGHWRYTLDEIEKGVLLGHSSSTNKDAAHLRRIRPSVVDPRIHFALVCAARGCPKLRRVAFESSRVGAQLDHAVRDTLADRSRAQFELSSRTMRLTQILKWYGDDFSNTDHEPHWRTLPAFLAYHFADPQVDKSLRLDRWKTRYLNYDWSLNLRGQPTP